MNPIQSPASLAVSRALAEAELRRMKMSRNLNPARTAVLLNEQADAAATSPLAYDQLLSIALRAAARPGELESPELDALRSPPDPIERHYIAREVFTRFAEQPYRALLKAAPDWELRRGVRRVGRSPQALARWLRQAAGLARELWDHPALPVAPAFRGAILGGVTSLRRRADELAPQPAPATQADGRRAMTAAA
jgi:hypothetical protein